MSPLPPQIAPTKEVLVGVSNINPLREGMLDTFLWSVKQAGVKNYLIVALDQETAADLTARGYNAFYMPIQVGRVYSVGGVSPPKSPIALPIQCHTCSQPANVTALSADRDVRCQSDHCALRQCV